MRSSMLAALAPAAAARLRPLFADFPGLHGCVDAVLEGAMGRAYADDVGQPSVGHIQLDFDLIAGDASAPAAEAAVRSLDRPATVVVSNHGWEPLLRRVWGDRLSTRLRTAFQPGTWQRDKLHNFIEELPHGFALRRVTAENVRRFAEVAGSLVYNYPSLEEFVANGIGFGVEHEGRFVSGCSSFALSSRSLEFEIQTHPDFRRRGLASAAAAAMILHCLDNGLKPCWDAHNEMSSALALKLGFRDPAPYVAYEL